MRIVADTNVVVSGLLWRGAPRQVLEAAREGTIELFTSAELLAELDDVLRREKLAERLARASVLPRVLVFGYAALASLVEPAHIETTIREDPDDDAVLACALAARADRIVSGDRHLLSLGGFQGIAIIRAEEVARLLSR